MKKDYINDIPKVERRYIDPLMEVRAGDGDNQQIRGIAAVVDKTTDLGFFEERLSRGAFDNVLNDDVVALFNHDSNLPLARTTAKNAGKLTLRINEDGHLAYSYPQPTTSIGKDLTENIRNEVIQHSSFAFTIAEEVWEFASKENGREKDLRTITKIERLYDVSPVTYPAYNDTKVGVRNKESLISDKEQAHNKNHQEIEDYKREMQIVKIKSKIKVGK